MNLKYKQGFTIIEFLIYIALSGFVATSIINIFITNSQVHQNQENVTAVFQEARTALSFISSEIRSAGCDPFKSNEMGFVDDTNDDLDTDNNSIHFTRDIAGNSDGRSLSPNENVAFYIDTFNRLIRNDGGVNQIVVENVTDLTFSYFDVDGADITSDVSNGIFGALRTVQVSITVQTENSDLLSKKKKSITLLTRVKVRNLGL